MNTSSTTHFENSTQGYNKALSERSDAVQLTEQQTQVLNKVKDFVRSGQPCLVLRGGAGTGKTTLIKAITEAIEQRHIPVQLLAPTGRAARILSRKTSQGQHTARETSTIHGAIYKLGRLEVRPESSDDNDPTIRYHFPLKAEAPTRAVWIVDESSMVGDSEQHNDLFTFGSGRLLRDLLHFLRLDRESDAQSGAQVIFVGDPIQLPPVGSQGSALDLSTLTPLLKAPPIEVELTEVHRQAEDSGILRSATRLREAVLTQQLYRARLEYNQNVQAITTLDTLQKLVTAHQQNKSSVAISYSNAEARKIINMVRERLFGDAQHPMQEGERLLVMKNHHGYELSNGDLIRVEEPATRHRSVTVMVRGQAPIELRFAHVRVSDLSAPERGSRMVWLLDNSLWLDERDEPASLTQALLVDLEQRLREEARRKQDKPPKRGTETFSNYLLNDELFNALRVRFGYALTCHKAQGGEWDEVLLKPKSLQSLKSEFDVRWLYTAVTRARTDLFVIGGEDSTEVSCNQDIQTQRADLEDQSSQKTKLVQVKGLDTLDAAGRAEVLLRGALKYLDHNLLRLDHSQYLIKAFIEGADGQATSVEMNYKGTGKPSALRGAGVSTLGLSVDFLKSFTLAEELTEAQNETDHEAQLEAMIAELPKAFYQEQLRRVHTALKPLSIRVTKVRVESWALALWLSGPKGEGRIKFHHNSKDVWTSITVVDGTKTAFTAQTVLN